MIAARQLTIVKLGGRQRGAIFSPCGKFRYRLWRRWGAGRSLVAIGANPSTATAELDDPTVRRWIDYAKQWGFGGLDVVNVFGLRSTDPRGLASVDDPVGPKNDGQILAAAYLGGMVLASWGEPWKKAGAAVSALAAQRQREIRNLLVDVMGLSVFCLGTTKSGAPRHPLYLRKDERTRLLWSPTS